MSTPPTHVPASAEVNEIVFSEDPHTMNWLRPDYPYAQVCFSNSRIPTPLEVTSVTERTGDEIRTKITLTNIGNAPYFSAEGEIGIRLPLEDRYDLAEDQLTKRCNVHLFCGGTSSFVVALRMGGAAPHLGLVLTQGSLSSYSIERDIAKISNDRGCFILNLEPLALAPGASTTISWVIFPFSNREEFLDKAGEFTNFVHASWDRYVLFQGEQAELTIRPSFAAQEVRVNQQTVEESADGSYRLTFTAEALGEQSFNIDVDGRTVNTRILVKVPFEQLLENRCRFIAQKQQYDGPISGLRGAYLVYDNEDEQIYYSQEYDFNAGRERVGMAVLLAQYLLALRHGKVRARRPDTERIVRSSLDKYLEFFRRELIDEATGEAFNDFNRDNSYQRLYNAPWYAMLLLTVYRLDGHTSDARTAFRVIQRFYEEGGRRFYPLEMPIADACMVLEQAGLTEELQTARQLFLEHARELTRIGTHYPPSEVNYEQSIVVPAVEILLQTHSVTGDPELRNAAEPHIRAMDQFQGMAPDYHLNEVAIRHWDGYWFGKHGQYGDTFPHYWSGLTGNALASLFRITGEQTYADRASRAFRGVLPLIFDDGRASCAYVFPHAVNGMRTAGYDPYANDQDWGLVFALRQYLNDPEMNLL